VRRGAGSGVEVRVRAVRRRNWSTEDKLRIVRETLAPGAVAKVDLPRFCGEALGQVAAILSNCAGLVKSRAEWRRTGL
jgi:transposase-like protein